jgi:murein DD-endopeptidase MepM/ murein hydrolase activator NlpD
MVWIMGKISKKTRNKILSKKNKKEEVFFNIFKKVFKIIIFMVIIGGLFYSAFKYKIIPVNFLSENNVFLSRPQDVLEFSFMNVSNYDFEYKYWALDYQPDENIIEKDIKEDIEEENSELNDPKNLDIKNSKVEMDETFYVPLKGEISSGFGMRLHPIKGTKEMHNGVDIKANHGEPYFAFANGEVEELGFEASLGNYIKLKHDDGITSYYLHSSKLLVEKGQKVKGGEKIGLVGSTGYAVGPHLHFEIRRNNMPINPLEIIEKW